MTTTATKSLEDRVKDLEAKLEQLKKCESCSGGMLSDKDIREFAIYEGKQGVDFQSILKQFREREWNTIGNKIIINPYSEENVTPFSYDLSVGNKLLSVRKHDKGIVDLPYDIQPGETVAIITKEFIALPPCYAATIWPRFGFVLEGVFQSMVKIDPTWYGNLTVAVSNLSPRTFTLNSGFRFATLVLYGLTQQSDVELWTPTDLRTQNLVASTSLTALPVSDLISISQRLEPFRGLAWIEGNVLKVCGLKSNDYTTLRAVDTSSAWQAAIDDVWKKWLDTRTQKLKRIEPTASLGMTDLRGIADRKLKGKPINLDNLEVTDNVLQGVAKEYGHPFELVFGLPKMISERTSETVKSEISNEIGRKVYPDIVTLVFRIVSALSFVVVLITLAIKTFLTTDFKAQLVVAVALAVVGIAGAVGLAMLPKRSVGGR
jgi:deoxycytidine triphosphate deaminase